MKKVFLTLLALLFAIQLTACNGSPAESGETSSSISTEEFSVEGLSYEAPAEWRQEQEENFIYHYPYLDTSAGFLYLYYSEIDFSSVTNTDTLYQFYDSVLDGVENGSKNFQQNQKDKIILAGVNAIKLDYSSTMENNSEYRTEMYLLADVQSNLLYGVSFIMRNDKIEEMHPYITPVLDSLRIKQKGIIGQKEDSSEEESSDASLLEENNAEPSADGSSSSKANSTSKTETQPDQIDNSEDEKVSPSQTSGETVSQKNAVNKAKSYLSFMAFSYEGLIHQLEYEKFSHEDAVYGVDHCGADWNEQALKKAKSYLDVMGFSYEGLTRQLSHDGFTSEQVAYGVDNCGADWNEQAAKKAKSYLDVMSFSRDRLIDQLIFDGFTQDQAEYGADSVGL